MKKDLDEMLDRKFFIKMKNMIEDLKDGVVEAIQSNRKILSEIDKTTTDLVNSAVTHETNKDMMNAVTAERKSMNKLEKARKRIADAKAKYEKGNN